MLLKVPGSLIYSYLTTGRAIILRFIHQFAKVFLGLTVFLQKGEDGGVSEMLGRNGSLHFFLIIEHI